MRNVLTVILVAIVALMVSWTAPAWADPPNGKQLFNAICSACHIGGTNVIIADKTLRKEALAKYGMNSLEAIKTQVANGKNAMPAFGSRLSDEQITAVAEYVLSQSEKGW